MPVIPVITHHGMRPACAGFVQAIAMRLLSILMFSTGAALATGAAAAESTRRSHHLESETGPPSTCVRTYAQETGVSLEDARLALAREELAVPKIDALRAAYADRLAGLFWVRVPTQHIVVRLTGNQQVQRSSIQTDAGVVPVIFVTGAAATTEELSARLRAAGPELRNAIADLSGSWVDETAGRIVLDVAAPAASSSAYDAERVIVEKVIGFPVEFRFVSRPQDLNAAPDAR